MFRGPASLPDTRQGRGFPSLGVPLIKPFAAARLAACLASPLALAQSGPSDPDVPSLPGAAAPGEGAGEEGDGGRDGDERSRDGDADHRDRDRDRRDRDRDRDARGDRDRRGAPDGRGGRRGLPPERRGPPLHDARGFSLHLGRGVHLDVRCGDEAMRACVEAVGPLLERLDATGRGD